MTTSASAAAVTQPIGVKVAAALAGALAVAAAAQVAIPIPGSPVPFTLQPLAVLVVGGLLGLRFGALALVMYLTLGAVGLPVFTPYGAPGLARLVGPTGGFLLAYPIAAAIVGWGVSREGGKSERGSLTDGPTYRLTALACLTGMAIIFAGGVAQLSILSGRGLALGLLPFIWTDLVKVLLAALVIRRLAAATRALR